MATTVEMLDMSVELKRRLNERLRPVLEELVGMSLEDLRRNYGSLKWAWDMDKQELVVDRYDQGGYMDSKRFHTWTKSIPASNLP